jgi:hypothetical protein
LYNAKSAVRWDGYEFLITRLINNNIPIILLSHTNEKNIIKDIDKLRRRPGVSVITNSSYKFLSGVIRKSKLVLTHPYSDIFWLSYASLQCTMVFSGPDRNKIPNVGHIIKFGEKCTCKYGPEKCAKTPCLSNLKIEEVYEEICRKL